MSGASSTYLDVHWHPIITHYVREISGAASNTKERINHPRDRDVFTLVPGGEGILHAGSEISAELCCA